MLRFDRVGKRYPDGTVAVRELSLDVTDGEVCVLIGPSGCGKTTVLKMANRLVQPSSGRVLLDGEDVTTSDPVTLRRRIGYVIQSVGLFPHLTVAGNVGTVPRLLGWERRRTSSRVDEMLALVGLDPRLHGRRYPHELSGGQRQRVGVARALAADPPVLLMDEPFGAVDPVARDRLQGEFLRLQQQVRKTVVFVTHDLDEAVRLGDRVAVLSEGGVLQQHDTPGRLLARPQTPFVTEFVGGDRAVRRLSVTPLERGALLDVPAVGRGGGADAARAAARASASGFVVVVDGDNRPVGWLGGAPGATADAPAPLPPTVALGADLRSALAAVLRSPTAWAVALDGDAYAGVVTLPGVHGALGRDQDTGPA